MYLESGTSNQEVRKFETFLSNFRLHLNSKLFYSLSFLFSDLTFVSFLDTFMELPFGDSFTVSVMMHPSTYLNKILFGSKQGPLQLWNIRTQKLIYTFSGWNSGVMVIEQAPAVDVVAIGLENGYIMVHNLKFDKKIVRFYQEWGPVLALSFRTDGPPFLASASNQNHVAIWDLENRRLLTQMRDIHSDLVCGCQFILKEPLLVTNANDNSVKVWCFDKSDGTARLLHSREGHFKTSNKIRFYQSDFLFIFSVSSDSTFRCFSVWSEKLNRSFGKTLKNRKAVKRRKIIEEVDLLPPAVDFSAGKYFELVSLTNLFSHLFTYLLKNRFVKKTGTILFAVMRTLLQ